MKNWNSPDILKLDLRETAKPEQGHGNGNNLGNVCIYDSTRPCNSQGKVNGNGLGVCNNCRSNPSFSTEGLS